MEVALLIALIVANGLFAMSEIALITARRARLAKLAAEGNGSAEAALKLAEDPNRMLSTVQIGITSIGILNGIVGEAALAGPIASWLVAIGMPVGVASPLATASVVIVITYFTIVVGELVPKRIAQVEPETIARLVARPMTVLATLSRPFVWGLSASTQAILRLIGVRSEDAQRVTEEEIHAMIDEGSSAGIIERDEHAILRNVFRLDERRVGTMMMPKSEMIYLDRQRPLDENLTLVVQSQYSRFPVCDGGLDRVIGFLHSKQLLGQALASGNASLDVELESPLFVPETLTGLELLEGFRQGGRHVALVVDEYGDVQGLVTLYDVFEAIAGELRTPDIEDADAVQRDDGSWLLDGLIAVHDLKARLGLESVPEEEFGRYNALSGMLMLLLGRLPRTGDVAVWENWRFEVVDLDGRRVDKVLATLVTPVEPPPEIEDEPPAQDA
ncbi:MAG: hemolysin family protein [Burkholderiaceae bacterium]